MTNLIVLTSALLFAFLVMSTSSTKQNEGSLTSTAPKSQFSGCGKTVYDNIHSKIIGGRTVNVEGKFPWVVALLERYGPIWVQFCGAAIISDRHILTAAHCIEKNMRPSALKVRLGETNMNSTHASPSRRDVSVSKIFRHESFDENTFFNDIAILELKEKIAWNDTIRPICLPTAAAALNLEGKMATVAGWGREAEYAFGGSDFLMEVDLPIIEVSRCEKAYSEVEEKMPIVKEQICAGYPEGEKDSCQGDSGGPLMFRMDHTKPWIVLAIVSHGFGCARKGVPGVYTRVESYRDWIQSKMDIKMIK